METLYRKVAVSHRLPNRVGYYFTAIGIGSKSESFFDGRCFKNNINKVTHWLEEIPDPTAQLKAEKAELLEVLEDVKPALRYFPEKLAEIESLIQKMKQ